MNWQQDSSCEVTVMQLCSPEKFRLVFRGLTPRSVTADMTRPRQWLVSRLELGDICRTGLFSGLGTALFDLPGLWVDFAIIFSDLGRGLSSLQKASTSL